VKNNIKKKYEIITGKKVNDFEFDIKPKGKTRHVPLKYKNFFIKGVEGEFILETNPEIFKEVYDAGLGAKNSQGFGMVEVVSEK